MEGICEIDVHGLNKFQAKTLIDSRLKSASRGVYRLRIVHGYHGGTELRNMVRSAYKNNPKVLRVEVSLNAGITDLVLREFF